MAMRVVATVGIWRSSRSLRVSLGPAPTYPLRPLAIGNQSQAVFSSAESRGFTARVWKTTQ
jgi:hypothetical protein